MLDSLLLPIPAPDAESQVLTPPGQARMDGSMDRGVGSSEVLTYIGTYIHR